MLASAQESRGGEPHQKALLRQGPQQSGQPWPPVCRHSHSDHREHYQAGEQTVQGLAGHGSTPSLDEHSTFVSDLVQTRSAIASSLSVTKGGNNESSAIAGSPPVRRHDVFAAPSWLLLLSILHFLGFAHHSRHKLPKRQSDLQHSRLASLQKEQRPGIRQSGRCRAHSARY